MTKSNPNDTNFNIPTSGKQASGKSVTSWELGYAKVMYKLPATDDKQAYTSAVELIHEHKYTLILATLSANRSGIPLNSYYQGMAKAIADWELANPDAKNITSVKYDKIGGGSRPRTASRRGHNSADTGGYEEHHVTGLPHTDNRGGS